MEITIKGSAKEIAALALELQERRFVGINLESPKNAIAKAFTDLVHTSRDMPAK